MEVDIIEKYQLQGVKEKLSPDMLELYEFLLMSEDKDIAAICDQYDKAFDQLTEKLFTDLDICFEAKMVLKNK